MPPTAKGQYGFQSGVLYLLKKDMLYRVCIGCVGSIYGMSCVSCVCCVSAESAVF